MKVEVGHGGAGMERRSVVFKQLLELRKRETRSTNGIDQPGEMKEGTV